MKERNLAVRKDKNLRGELRGEKQAQDLLEKEASAQAGFNELEGT